MKLRVNLADHGDEGRHVSEPYGEIEVTLSRRNLLSLLHKVDWDGSERTIQKFADSVVLNVVVEDDAEHYGDNAAGVMHDETERFIESLSGGRMSYHVTDRGFKHYDRIPTDYGHEIRVYESSSAEAPKLWLKIEGTDQTKSQGLPDNCCHLTFDQAEALIETLRATMANHYQLDGTS